MQGHLKYGGTWIRYNMFTSSLPAPEVAVSAGGFPQNLILHSYSSFPRVQLTSVRYADIFNKS
jgi:hypothetical protein